MKQVETRTIRTYEELAPLLSAQLRRGVRTNSFGDYRKDIAHGDVLTFHWDGGLLILRKRAGFDHWLLNFYLHELTLLPLPPLDGPVVVEIAARPRDTAMGETARFFRDNGFAPLTGRQRLCLPAGTVVPPGNGPLSARIAESDDILPAAQLLTDCFDPLSGCLPDVFQLEEALSAGNAVALTDVQGTLAGLLHIGPGRGSTELRHLAVREDCRRLGGAQKLLALYLEHTGFAKSLVWVRSDNAPALRFYEKNGYTPDGWRSAVLCRPAHA